MRAITVAANRPEDLTYTTFPSVLWSVIEIDLGIICGCLPIMMPILHFLRRKYSSRHSSSPNAPHRERYPRSSSQDGEVRNMQRQTTSSSKEATDISAPSSSRAGSQYAFLEAEKRRRSADEEAGAGADLEELPPPPPISPPLPSPPRTGIRVKRQFTVSFHTAPWSISDTVPQPDESNSIHLV